jgi:acyl carrier protein
MRLPRWCLEFDIRPYDGEPLTDRMDNITTRFDQCLRRHLCLVKPDSVNYAVELVQLGLDSMTAVAILLDMKKTFDIRFPDGMLVEGTFRTTGRLKGAVQLHRERQAS